jgi:predicted dehydrogenase
MWQFEPTARQDTAIRRKFARRVGGGGGAADPKAISYAGHREQLKDFVQSIQTGRKPQVDGEEGRKSVEIILAIYKAAESGRAVKLPLKSDIRR